MANLKSFYDTDIAMMEHELLKECAVSDWKPEELQMYIMGMQDMADKIIAEIRKKEAV